VFYINIPLAAAALLLTRHLMPVVPANRSRLDVFGAVTATAGLTATVYTIVRAPEVGWTSTRTLVTGGIAVVLLSLFVRAQATRTSPQLRLDIFRERNLSAANVAQFLLGAAWIPMWFFLNLYLQQVLGLGAFASGAALLPMTVVITVLMVTVAPRLIARHGPKTVLVTGMSVLAAGMAALSFVRPGGSFLVDVLPASIVAATGMAFAFIPSLGIALSSARPEEGGLAAGLVNTSYQVGSALGLAVMTAVATSHGAGQLGNITALTGGYAKAFVGAAVIAAAGAVIAGITLRTRPAAPTPSQEVPASAPVHAA
jgi:predicted MFS family arabinose efflux permease